MNFSKIDRYWPDCTLLSSRREEKAAVLENIYIGTRSDEDSAANLFPLFLPLSNPESRLAEFCVLSILVIMDTPPANVASQIPGLELRNQSMRNVMKSLAQHEDLYATIEKHPQAGVYQRFTNFWSFCLYYLESEVYRLGYEAKQMCDAENQREEDSEIVPQPHERFAETMDFLFEALEKHGKCRCRIHLRRVSYLITPMTARGVHWARELTQPPSPSNLFMNFFRAHLKGFDGRTNGPNGEDTSIYKPENDPVPFECLPLDNDDLNPVEWLLVLRLMNPFVDFICLPFRYLMNKTKRGKDSRPLVEQNVVDFAVISAVAKVIVCMLANLSLAAAIGTLDRIDSTKKTTRIIVMTVVGLVFASLVSLIGSKSIPIYTLITS